LEKLTDYGYQQTEAHAYMQTGGKPRDETNLLNPIYFDNLIT